MSHTIASYATYIIHCMNHTLLKEKQIKPQTIFLCQSREQMWQNCCVGAQHCWKTEQQNILMCWYVCVIVWLIPSLFPCVYLTCSPPMCALFIHSKSIHHFCVYPAASGHPVPASANPPQSSSVLACNSNLDHYFLHHLPGLLCQSRRNPASSIRHPTSLQESYLKMPACLCSTFCVQNWTHKHKHNHLLLCIKEDDYPSWASHFKPWPLIKDIINYTVLGYITKTLTFFSE